MPAHETSKIVLRGFSWPTLFLLILIFLCIMILTWRAVARAGSRGGAVVLVLLRGVALVALCLAILQPEIVRRKTEILRSEIIVLHDGSMSMNLPSGAEALSRQETVQKAFVAQPDFLDSIRRDFNVKFLEFGDKVLEGGEEMLLRAEGGKMPRTDLQKALKTVLDDHASDALEGIILVSDGADTELSSLPQQRHDTLDGELERLGIPVFTLCPVDGTALSDIALSGIRCSRLAFVRSRWKADVQISTEGLSSGRCHVVLRRRGNIVDIAQLNLRKNKTRYEVSLSFVPDKTGRTLLSFEVQPHPDEKYYANNRLGVVLNTVRDKIRVLQVGGRPSWDVRFLRRFLKQIPTVDLVSFFILRDQSDRPEPRGSVRGSYVNLIPFPTEELFTRELRTFDIIIFQNFDYRIFLGYRVDFPSYLENICEHVLKRGAGFIMIGGNQSFDRGPYAGTGIAQILPVDLKKGQGAIDERSYKPVLTDSGQSHPITKIESGTEENDEAWQRAPELNGCHVLPELSKDALVLLRHPFLKGEQEGVPIVAVRETGEGRTMAILTDELWRWSFRSVAEGAGISIYNRFWRNALRWLLGETGKDRVDLQVQDRKVHAGQEIRGKVEIYGANYKPEKNSQVGVNLFNSEGDKKFEKKLATDEEGKSLFSLPGQPHGVYKIEAGRLSADKAEQSASVYISVETDPLETRHLSPDERLLAWIAEESGGKFYNVAREDLPADLPLDGGHVEKMVARETDPLWSNWVMYGVVAACLMFEWWLRRRRGLT